MFKFNNNHIFTGYLKQLLASFHLPKCKIYTKELAQQEQKYNELVNTNFPVQQELKTAIAELKILKELALQKNSEEEYLMLQEIQNEYSAENEIINKQLLAAKPQIISTTYHSKYDTYSKSASEPEDASNGLQYPANLRYIPYIKDGYLQVYTEDAWHNCHASFKKGPSHGEFHKNAKIPYTTISYTYGQKILNYTKNLQIQNTVYDSYTHEYLGDYLRFHRDFANINLMPLYNCFSNRACPHLDLTFNVGKNGDMSKNYEVKFKTDQSFETSLYKYYMVPVKFFKNYTIAIDSEASIEVCCCIYNEYHNADTDFKEIPQLTYQCFSDMQFKRPVLYNKIQNLNNLLLNPTESLNDLCQQEDNLKLILKIPVNNKSSIVILEGDYTSYNDITYSKSTDDLGLVESTTATVLTGQLRPEVLETHQAHEQAGYHSNCEICKILKDLQSQKNDLVPTKQTNKTIINYESLDACDFLVDKLITPLQLLRMNTNESYPFADRLVEYLIGNAITVNEEIKDNIVRAKTVISKNCHTDVYQMEINDGIWEPILQCLIYDHINNNQNIHDINHDILGFVDKDVEKWYTAKSDTGIETIANVDIYKDQWRN